MSWDRCAENPVNGSTGSPAESARRPSRRGLGRLSISACAFLGVLVLGYLVCLSLRTKHASPAGPPSKEPVEDSIAGVAGTELVSTRVIASRPQEPSPFRFTEIASRPGSTSCISRG